MDKIDKAISEDDIMQLRETLNEITMEKLTIEKLAPYLPYGLKFYWEDFNNKPIEPWEMTSTSIQDALDNQNKPILRPLSDLTEDMYWQLSGNKIGESFGFWYGKYNGEHNKREFIHREGYSSTKFFLDNGYDQFTYKMIQFFFKHHFDVFGLIPEGLAIDINTL